MMTEAVKWKTEDEAGDLFDRFHDLVTGKGADPESLGKLAVFQGVSEFPIRVKCASLSWHTLKAALEAKGTVSMERGSGTARLQVAGLKAAEPYCGARPR